MSDDFKDYAKADYQQLRSICVMLGLPVPRVEGNNPEDYVNATAVMLKAIPPEEMPDLYLGEEHYTSE